MKNRTHSRTFRVTRTQAAAVQHWASLAAGADTSHVMRYLLRRAYAKPAHPPAYARCLRIDLESGAHGPSEFSAVLRDQRVCFRLSTVEAEMLGEMAHQHGCGDSAFLRALIIDQLLRTDPATAARWAHAI